jgi:hypothetical protein
MKANYKHLRGFPLRQAVVDLAYELLHLEDNDKISSTLMAEIIEKANEHIKMTFDTLVYPSLNNLTETFVHEKETKIALFDLHYKNLTRYPLYEKVLLHAVSEFIMKQGEEVKEIALSDLKGSFLITIESNRRKLWFDTFNKFCNVIEKNKDTINNHSSDLGFSLYEKEGIIIVNIDQKREWFEFVKNSKKCFGRIDTDTVDTENTGNTALNINSIDGENGEKSYGADSTGNKENEILPAFNTIKKSHYEWTLEFYRAHKPPYKIFEREFYAKWGKDFLSNEIYELYRMIEAVVNEI